MPNKNGTKIIDEFAQSVFKYYQFVHDQLTAQFVFEFLDATQSSPEWEKISRLGVEEIRKSLDRLENEGWLDSKMKNPTKALYDDIQAPLSSKRVKVYFRRGRKNEGVLV